MTIRITSPAFEEGGMIPAQYTADGEDISPPLEWSGIPDEAVSIALICDDPDAPKGTWVHWVIYDLSSVREALREGLPPDGTLQNGARQGMTDFGTIGYGGPAPPSGTHRYFFRIYALDVMLRLRPGTTRAQLDEAMEGHILDEGVLMGKYKRQTQ